MYMNHVRDHASPSQPLSAKRKHTLSPIIILFMISPVIRTFLSPVAAGELGANKFDLAGQYTAPAPDGVDDAGYRLVRQAMAEKAIADARDAGLKFLRVGVTGYFPVNIGDKRNALAQWQSDPAAYWAGMDRMFDDLDRAGVRLVPSFLWQAGQFAALGKDSLETFVSDPKSPSRGLFTRYLGDFIGRYGKRRTILFYELGNEMNLLADLDLHGRCPKDRPPPCVWNHFSTAEMNAFARDVVGQIKSLDPSRQVDSGYAIPRPAAAHLVRHPAYAPGGPDWTPDTPAEFRDNLFSVNQSFDVISVHIYPGKENVRFGRTPGEEYKLVDDSEAAARQARKPLFIGEFGDEHGATPFMTHMFDEIARQQVAYAAVWAWEFYQTSTYRTHDTSATRFSIEPGYFDDVIPLLIKTEGRLGDAPPARAPTAVPRVVLTWPLPCAAIDRPIEFSAVASDGVEGVKSVEFLVDGKPVATVPAPPYAATFDPGGLPAGSVTITARATGQTGRIAAFSSRVDVNGASGCGAR